MAVDIKELKISSRSFANIMTSIGDLYLFEIRLKEFRGIEEKLGSKLEELDSEEFFRRYLPFFVYLKKDLVGEKLERPEEYTLTSEDVKKLSKDELEEIAKLFIQKHKYLAKDFKSGKIEESLVKKSNESYLEYVYRLFLKSHKRDQERAKKMFSSFSSGLSTDILKTMQIGDSLKSSLAFSKVFDDATKSIGSQFTSIEPVKHDIHKFDFAEMHRKQEERRVAPFKDLSSKMDLMIETEKQTVSFMSDVYETQVEIANELKASSDSANENSKLNIKLTQLVIWLTAVAVLVSVYTVWFDNSSQKLVKANENIKSSIIETNSKLEKLTKVLIEQNKMQSEQITVLREEIKSIQSSAVVVGRNLVSDQNSSNQ